MNVLIVSRPAVQTVQAVAAVSAPRSNHAWVTDSGDVEVGDLIRAVADADVHVGVVTDEVLHWGAARS